MTGFIAQEVEKAAKESGYNFSGVQKAEDNLCMYSVSYAQFVVPLVKAVQEQQEMIEKKETKINELEEGANEKDIQFEILQQQMNAQQKEMEALKALIENK